MLVQILQMFILDYTLTSLNVITHFRFFLMMVLYNEANISTHQEETCF